MISWKGKLKKRRRGSQLEIGEGGGIGRLWGIYLTPFFAGFVFFVRSEGSKRWDKQYYRRSKDGGGGDEVGGCLPREVHHPQPSLPPQTSWLPAWCRLFHKKPKKPATVEKEGAGRFTVISCDSQVYDGLKI